MPHPQANTRMLAISPTSGEPTFPRHSQYIPRMGFAQLFRVGSTRFSRMYFAVYIAAPMNVQGAC